jgi:hypothetical protein
MSNLSTKPKAKSGWERIKVTDMTVFAELIQLSPPALLWENIDHIEINGVAVTRDASFLGYMTDLSQPVRSLRFSLQTSCGGSWTSLVGVCAGHCRRKNFSLG